MNKCLNCKHRKWSNKKSTFSLNARLDVWKSDVWRRIWAPDPGVKSIKNPKQPHVLDIFMFSVNWESKVCVKVKQTEKKGWLSWRICGILSSSCLSDFYQPFHQFSTMFVDIPSLFEVVLEMLTLHDGISARGAPSRTHLSPVDPFHHKQRFVSPHHSCVVKEKGLRVRDECFFTPHFIFLSHAPSFMRFSLLNMKTLLFF